MKALFEIWNLIDNYLTRGIFISIMLILAVKLSFKNKLNTEVSISFIRIVLITHSIVYIIQLNIFFLLENADSIFWTRALGPYWWAYWTMIVMNGFLPLTLLMKRSGNNNFYLLIVSILINIGWILESFIIHITSMERDFMPKSYNPYLPTSQEISILINGLTVGVFLLIVCNLYLYWRKQLK